MNNGYDLKELLKYIKPYELTYSEWINVGMALKQEGYTAADWEEWSTNDIRHKQGECFMKWGTFNGNADPVTGGTIVEYAKRGGFIPPSKDPGRELDWDSIISREEKEDGVTYDRIAEQMNIAVSEVAYALDAISDPVSLYDPVYNKAGDTLLLMDQIFDEKNNDEAWTEKAALYEAMQKLDEREKRILYLRYFEGKTQTEISGQVGISQAQVSRLEKNALKRMRAEIC